MDQKKAVGCGLRTALWGMVIIGGIVIGFIFLIRSCLSQWDTYGMMGWPGITDDQKTMVIVKSYSKTNSYSNKNGIVHKSYTTTYYLEKIDLATGKMVQKKKLMNQRRIKNGGMQCFGGYKDRLWVFANYLRAYDMNSLEQVVKLEDIENKNPELKGKMPAENQYYDAHVNLGYITVTAQDGDKYKIMLDDLDAELIDEREGSFDEFSKGIKAQQEALEMRMDSLNELYRQDRANYEKLNEERTGLYAIRDSLQRLEQNSRDIFNAQMDRLRKMEGFDDFFANDISDWATTKDTLRGFGFVLTKEEPNDENFDPSNPSSVGSESDKVTLYKMTLQENKKASSNWDRLKVTKTEGFKERYLQGGIMIDFKTALTYKAKNPDGFIIFSRDIIGNKGKLLVSRVDINGKQLWQTNAAMSFKVSFALATDSYLIVCGVVDQDKSPSFASADAIRIFDLKTGNLVSVKF